MPVLYQPDCQRHNEGSKAEAQFVAVQQGSTRRYSGAGKRRSPAPRSYLRRCSYPSPARHREDAKINLPDWFRARRRSTARHAAAPPAAVHSSARRGGACPRGDNLGVWSATRRRQPCKAGRIPCSRPTLATRDYLDAAWTSTNASTHVSVLIWPSLASVQSIAVILPIAAQNSALRQCDGGASPAIG